MEKGITTGLELQIKQLQLLQDKLYMDGEKQTGYTLF